jgi:30S ribosomal protein S31
LDAPRQSLRELFRLKTQEIMGKGDKKTKRGKINRGTFGVRRPRIKKKPSVETKISIDKKAIVK